VLALGGVEQGSAWARWRSCSVRVARSEARAGVLVLGRLDRARPRSSRITSPASATSRIVNRPEWRPTNGLTSTGLHDLPCGWKTSRRQ